MNMRRARFVGVVAAVAMVVAWSFAAWADGDDDNGGGGAGDQPAEHHDDQPATGDQPDDHAGDQPADDHADDHAGSADDHADEPGEPAGDEHEQAAQPDEPGDEFPGDADNDGVLDSQEGQDGYDPDEDNEGEPPYVEWDVDGDGKVDPDDIAFQKDYAAAFEGVPKDVTDAELDTRAADKQLLPSLTVDQFRKMVRMAKTKVLSRLEAKIERKQAKKMLEFTYIVCGVSLLGVLLLLTPLFLRKKYPGQGKTLFKYAGLAALTWFVTVNLFGGVLYGMRTVQGVLSTMTNPQLAIAGGLFDTLDDHAERYIVTGKELFAPTLEQLQGNMDDQPVAVLLGNGMKIVHDAKVFKSMGSLVKKVDWLFAMLPIVLLLVTMLLFVLAIKPTLMEIIKLPMRAAAGEASAGREVMRTSMRRVVGELKATLCTLVVLALLSILSGFVLGQIVEPAIDGLLYYFSLAISYLQFQPGASSGLVFIALFGVIFFLVLNLATLILSMAFFLGKMQKVFQQRFTNDVPIARHRAFIKWALPSVIWVQLFPLLFLLVASRGLAAINDKVMSGATKADVVNWKAIMLTGPLMLVFAYLLLFWAARGVKAIKFLFAYNPKVMLDHPDLPRATGL